MSIEYWWNDVGREKNRSTRSKLVPASLCASQINELTWLSAVRGHWLASWRMAWTWKTKKIN